MRTSSLLRTSVLALAVGAAFSAQAVTIGLTSQGGTTDGAATVNETVLAQVGGFGPLSTLKLNTYSNPSNALGGSYSGTGTYTGTGGTLNFNFDFGPSVIQGGSIVYPGAWTLTSGTNTYANLTGSGVLSTNFFGINNATNATSFTTFSGTLEAVPEPASMVALGVGAVGLLRRRKRA